MTVAARSVGVGARVPGNGHAVQSASYESRVSSSRKSYIPMLITPDSLIQGGMVVSLMTAMRKKSRTARSGRSSATAFSGLSIERAD